MKSGLINSVFAILLLSGMLMVTGCSSPKSSFGVKTGGHSKAGKTASSYKSPKLLARTAPDTSAAKAANTSGTKAAASKKPSPAVQRQTALKTFDQQMAKSNKSLAGKKFATALNEVNRARDAIKKAKAHLPASEYKNRMAKANTQDTKVRKAHAAALARSDDKEAAKNGGIFDFKN
jgi:hypothetical protein